MATAVKLVATLVAAGAAGVGRGWAVGWAAGVGAEQFLLPQKKDTGEGPNINPRKTFRGW